jgi:uncharacterized protein (TIGR00369 family)
MKTPNPEHIAMIKQLVGESPFPSLLSLELTDIGTGFAVIETSIQSKHMQLMGAVHGGVLASLVDTVTYWSVYYGIEDPQAWLTTVDLKVNYLAPVDSGKLIARGRQIKVGKKLCYASAEVHSDKGAIIAHGSSTLFILKGIKVTRDFKFPAKFLG